MVSEDLDISRVLKDLRAPHRYALENLEARIERLQDIVDLNPRLNAEDFIQERKRKPEYEVESFEKVVINPLSNRIYTLREEILLGSPPGVFKAAYQRVKDLLKWLEFGGEKAFEISSSLRGLLRSGDSPQAQNELANYLRTSLLPAVILVKRSLAEVDSCMGVLENKPQLTELRRRRAAKVIQMAYKARLRRKARAATVIQRRFLEFRFRPEGQLARKTVKRLREAAEGGEAVKRQC